MASENFTKVLVTLHIAGAPKDAERKAHGVLNDLQRWRPDTVKGFTVIGVDDSNDVEAEFLAGLQL